jgi:hypothetical protein
MLVFSPEETYLPTSPRGVTTQRTNIVKSFLCNRTEKHRTQPQAILKFGFQQENKIVSVLNLNVAVFHKQDLIFLPSAY